MQDYDHTVTTPIHSKERTRPQFLTLSVLWHPDLSYVGSQFFAAQRGSSFPLNRYTPLFFLHGMGGMPLAASHISRTPIQVHWRDDDSVELEIPESRMVVEVNGTLATGTVALSEEEMRAGVVLALGRNIILCVHWMQSLPQRNDLPELIGIGSKMNQMRNEVRKYSSSELPVLIIGETGTGKELVAQAIHRLSARGKQRIVAVNMAVLNESVAAADLFGAVKGAYTGAAQTRTGYFDQAENSTLFLDEIGNTPEAVQAMLLRVLETNEYRPLGASQDKIANVRIISATDQNLYEHDGPNQFNHALLRRLEALVVQISPLRERREDIGILLLHFLREQSIASQQWALLDAGLLQTLFCYNWPGNVRQLLQIARRLALQLQTGHCPSFQALIGESWIQTNQRILGTELGVSSDTIGIPREPIRAEKVFADRTRKRSNLAEITHEQVLQAMQESGWTIRRAAEILEVSRPSLYKLLENHPTIRRPEVISRDELITAWKESGHKFEACAEKLQTPLEALRRYLQTMFSLDGLDENGGEI